MFAEQLRQAVEASPRVELAKVSALLWKAYVSGYVSESDAADLSALIEARKAMGSAPRVSPRRLVGSRPRSSESMERRRRWTASGWLPPQVACRFTLAETAVLAVVAAQVLKHAACTLTVGHIAALAGCSETTVRNALREAKRLCLVHVEERRVATFRSKPNRITIVSREWSAWLRMRARGVGAKQCGPRIHG